MAKISDTEVYPYDTTIDIRDYLLGTDWNNMKKTKTFPIQNIGLALGNAGVRVQEIYLGFAPLNINETPLSEQVQAMLDAHEISVDFNTLIIFKVLYYSQTTPDGAIPRLIPRQINYYYPFGFGNYNPISSVCNFSDLIIDYEQPQLFTIEDVINSPDAEVIDLGDLSTVTSIVLVDYLNSNGDTYALDDNQKNYYFRYEYDGISYLYFFNAASSINGYGIYGLDQLQFADNELVLLYDSSNESLQFNVDQYVKKEEFAENYVTGSSAISLVLNSEQTAFRLTSNTITVVEGTAPTTQYISSFGYTGKIITIINSTANNKTIKHSLDPWCFRFPDGNDFILGPNEVLTMRQTKTTVAYFDMFAVGKIYTGSGGSIGLQQVLENGNSYSASGKTITIIESGIQIYDEITENILNIGLVAYLTGQKPTISLIPSVGDATYIEFPLTEAIEEVAYKSYVDGIADTKADLVGGLVPSTQLPSYLDDVLEYANLASFPATGESGKVYVALDTNKTYRWTGSIYASLDEGLVLGETSSTAYRGDRGKTAYDHSQETGNPHGTTASQVGAYTTTEVNNLLASRQRIIIEDVTNYSHTGTLSETIVSNKKIDANTLKTSTVLELASRITRSSNLANATIKFYISPNNNSLTGATQIGTATITSTQVLPKFSRTYSINSSSELRGISGTQNAPSDEITSTTSILNLALTLTNDYYLITTITLSSSSDTVVQEFIYLKSSR